MKRPESDGAARKRRESGDQWWQEKGKQLSSRIGDGCCPSAAV